MTGIERLRDIAYDGPYSGGMIHISVQRLREICDQIEREAGVETVKSEAMEALAFVEEHGGLDAVKKRLMPEGMEWLVEAWPKFEDDAPLKLGDMALVDGDADMVEAIQLWIHGKPVIYGDNSSQQLEKGERVRRPAPQVLDADGVEIHKGDTVWSLGGGGPYTVAGFDGGTPYVLFDDGAGNVPALEPSALTHRAPVLAADGEPLREGETVWNVDGTGPYEVSSIDGNLVKMGSGACINRCNLTHERPESWERLEADAGKNPFDYCKDVGHRLDTCENSEAYKARDLVRRAKALAGGAS